MISLFDLTINILHNSKLYAHGLIYERKCITLDECEKNEKRDEKILKRGIEESGYVSQQKNKIPKRTEKCSGTSKSQD